MNRDQDDISHSNPIPIDPCGGQHRRRSGSLSSDSSGSPTTPLATPISSNPPKVATVSPSTSPILSYFMTQSPTAKTLPFRRGTIGSFGASGSVFEESEDLQGSEPNSNKIHRRASTAWAGTDRFQPPPPPPMGDNRHERATGLLRRLSLSTPFSRPPIVTTGFGAGDQNPVTPPNTAYPQSPTSANGRPKRASSPGRKPVKRAPSPMGERILKGHFDGFN